MNSHIYNLQERTECTKTEPKLRLWIVNYEIDKIAKGTIVVKARNANDASNIVLSNSQFNSVRDKFNIIRIEEIINEGTYAGLISEDYLIYPAFNSSEAFTNAPSDFQIIIPDAFYDEWATDTNWSSLASKIVKASKFVKS